MGRKKFSFDGEDGSSVVDNLTRASTFLAKFVEAGTIECDGEENEDLWQINFDGQGSFEIRYAKIIFESIFDAFLREYKDKLPEKLKKELHQFKVGLAI